LGGGGEQKIIIYKVLEIRLDRFQSLVKRRPLFKEAKMTVEQVAQAMGKTKWAIYKMIETKRGIGAKFKKNEFGIWVVNGSFVGKKKKVDALLKGVAK